MFSRKVLATVAAVTLSASAGFASLGASTSPDPPETATVLAAVPAAHQSANDLMLGLATQPFRAEMRSYLNTLPGGSSAGLEWGNPNGHLGGVYIPGGNTIILNAARLDGNASKTRDVLRHEIAHIHQNRIIAAHGLRVAEYEAHLNQVFGSNGIERAADAVACLLGAHSFYYQSNFTGAQMSAAKAILNDRLG